MNDKREMKKLLIYLYETFNANHDKIIAEMVERKIKADIKTVNEFIKSNNIRLTDYYVFYESKFPAEFKNVSRPIMVINKKLDKMVRRYFNYKLEADGTQGNKNFDGETLKHFLDELDIGYELTVREVNSVLQDNGLKPIKVI